MNSAQVLQKMITDWLRGTPTTPPTGLRVALSSADPLMNGAGLSEPPGADGYARQILTFGAEAFVNGSGTTVKNSAPIVFGPAVNNPWPPVTHICVFSQSGQLLLKGELASPRTVVVGDTYSLAIDALQELVR